MYSLKYHSSSSMKITVPLKPDRVVHTCNPATQEAQAGDHRFRVSLVIQSVRSQPGLHKTCLVPKDTISTYSSPEIIVFTCYHPFQFPVLNLAWDV